MYEIRVTKVTNPWAKVHQGEKTWWTLRSNSLQNFIALRQPMPEISVTKIPADRKTKNKQTNSNRYIHNMPIGMCG